MFLQRVKGIINQISRFPGKILFERIVGARMSVAVRVFLSLCERDHAHGRLGDIELGGRSRCRLAARQTGVFGRVEGLRERRDTLPGELKLAQVRASVRLPKRIRGAVLAIDGFEPADEAGFAESMTACEHIWGPHSGNTYLTAENLVDLRGQFCGIIGLALSQVPLLCQFLQLLFQSFIFLLQHSHQ